MTIKIIIDGHYLRQTPCRESGQAVPLYLPALTLCVVIHVWFPSVKVQVIPTGFSWQCFITRTQTIVLTFPPCCASPAESRKLGVRKQDPLSADSGGRRWPQNLLDPRAERRRAQTGECRAVVFLLEASCMKKKDRGSEVLWNNSWTWLKSMLNKEKKVYSIFHEYRDRWGARPCGSSVTWPVLMEAQESSHALKWDFQAASVLCLRNA